jgi:hypothetical protein
MSESRNIDIESLRRSRRQKICDRLDVLFGWLRKRGWLEAEAEVVECVSASGRTYYPYHERQGLWVSGYAVTFAYTVDGKRYEGTTVSPDPVELHSRMTIRYNPRHPAQNNSFDSETDWVSPAAKVEEVLALIFVLVAVVVYFFAQR